MAGAAGCAKLLMETSLDDLASQQNVCILKDTATVEQALRTLAVRRILSAPVVATSDATPTTGSCGCLNALFSQGVPPGAHWPQDRPLAGSHQILGFLDVRDILSSFLAELEGSGIKKMKMLQRMRLLEEKGSAFSTTAVKDLAVFGGDGDFFHTSEAKTSLLDIAVNALLTPKERGIHTGRHIVTGTVHRVAIHDSQYRLSHIISQTDIIKFLYMNKADLGELASATAAQLGWAARPVVSVGPDVSAIEAMHLMNEGQISAVAVVDGMGKIIGNFSISEMRTIMAEHFGALALPVGEFLALEHGTEFQGYSRIQEAEVVNSRGHKFITDRVARTRPRTPGEEVGQSLILVKPQATLAEVLDKIVSHRIHRVYVVDEEEKPCGLVTCTDVLRLVVKLVQEQQQQPQQQQEQQGAAASAAAAGQPPEGQAPT